MSTINSLLANHFATELASQAQRSGSFLDAVDRTLNSASFQKIYKHAEALQDSLEYTPAPVKASKKKATTSKPKVKTSSTKTAVADETAPKRGRGRPPGSKNKPKTGEAVAPKSSSKKVIEPEEEETSEEADGPYTGAEDEELDEIEVPALDEEEA